MYLVWGGGGVPGRGGVPGLGGCTWPGGVPGRGGVPGPGGCTWSRGEHLVRYPPCEQNHTHL